MYTNIEMENGVGGATHALVRLDIFLRFFLVLWFPLQSSVLLLLLLLLLMRRLPGSPPEKTTSLAGRDNGPLPCRSRGALSDPSRCLLLRQLRCCGCCCCCLNRRRISSTARLTLQVHLV